MNNTKFWLFRGSVIIALALFLVSWFLPWWSTYIDQLELANAIVIHPYGLENNMGDYGTLVDRANMPAWFTPFMWIYFSIVIVALFIGIIFKDQSISIFRKKLNISRWLIGIVGFTYVVVVIAAVLVMSAKMKAFANFNLVGYQWVSLGAMESSWIDAKLLFGFWLACAVGPLFIVLAFLRNKLVK
jgi:hypothetical protein